AYPDQYGSLWASDGTSSGTHKLVDRYNNYGSLQPLGESAFVLSAYDSGHGWELWSTDGTTNGTGLIKDINPGTSDSSPISSFVWKNRMFFWANDGEHGYELWQTDATATRTRLVK